MENTLAPESGRSIKKQTLLDMIKVLGPGIMLASTSIGGSHLVASTKSGAIYGWQLVLVIALVNLFKYPFFRAGIQYTMATGNSLVEGYKGMGRIYLWSFTFLSVVAAFVNVSALLLFSASLFGYIFKTGLPLEYNALILISACLVILFAGRYQALDKMSKVIVGTLSLVTIFVVIAAFTNGAVAPADYQPPTIWDLSAIGFIVIMMGWMPTTIEVSSITSLWLKDQRKVANVTPRSALFDFNVGYITTAVLALFFLALGALLLNGSGTELATSGIGFSHQLVGLYSSNIGEWSRYIVAILAFFCIFGSTLTCIDGYPRALAEAQRLILNKPENINYHRFWMLLVAAGAMLILFFYKAELVPMLNFAMILAFITTPIFALLNFRLISKTNLTGVLALTTRLKVLNWAGLVYLFGFLAVFIWWKFIL
ncbi:Nramp family divalent metal transporter [Reinekea thalattae]|uniref:Divalent metal cation transporter n=1 Tax=Reinekea thalattae TaxID=2593301 RepID=A0A5C8Z4R5_9GAMM|nr:Nramp family divalent metal transporter [Reinekea thalattae]TXR51906.1 divalent metal cation transporter [Reinekea thalattae]